MAGRKRGKQKEEKVKPDMWEKKRRHREVERNRHTQQKLALDKLISHVPSHPAISKTSITGIYRCARYGLFLQSLGFLASNWEEHAAFMIKTIHQHALERVDEIAQSKSNGAGEDTP